MNPEGDLSQEQAKINFATTVSTECPYVLREDALGFANEVSKLSPPPGFLERFAQAFVGMHVNEIMFHDEIEKMAETFKTFLNGREYYLVLPGEGKSNEWIADKLYALGVPKPQQVYSADYIENKNSDIREAYRIENEVPEGSLLVYFDDCMMSGAQVLTHTLSELSPKIYNKYDIGIFVLRMTGYARSFASDFFKKSRSLYLYGEKATTLGECLNDEDKQFIIDCISDPETNGRVRFDESYSMLTWWFGVPDSFPDPYEELGIDATFIDDDAIPIPEYRRR